MKTNSISQIAVASTNISWVSTYRCQYQIQTCAQSWLISTTIPARIHSNIITTVPFITLSGAFQLSAVSTFMGSTDTPNSMKKGRVSTIGIATIELISTSSSTMTFTRKAGLIGAILPGARTQNGVRA